MAHSENRPLDQYRYESASRVALATQETALNLAEEQLAETEYRLTEPQSNWPTLSWRRNPDADSGRYGRLCIHDKVSPAEFMSGLLKELNGTQANWFHDFNNLPEGAHYEPYIHDGGNWSNRLIKSAGQRAMASLLNDEPMAGQVDLIYMDPPYNINFRSNFQGLIDDTNTGDQWQDIPSDVRQVKAFRDSYRDGVHSYLDQLRVQLIHGRELLKDSGSFVMQIGPDNLHYVAVLMSEVFGHENHVATIPYRTTTNPSTGTLPEVGNWLVWFAKSKPNAKYHQLRTPIANRTELLNLWGHRAKYETETGDVRNITKGEFQNPDTIPSTGRLYIAAPCYSDHSSETGRSQTFYLHMDGKPCAPHSSAWDSHVCDPSCDRANSLCPLGKKCGDKCSANAYPCPTGKQWRVSLRGLHAIAQQGRLIAGQNITWKTYEEEVAGPALNAMWTNAGRINDKRYIVETPPAVLQRILLMTTDPGDLVLDPTCGSGAMPLMAERWGRRWIAIDSSAVSVAIARERIATAIHPYHLLQDSAKGHRREHELHQELLPADRRAAFQSKAHYRNDPAQGFVLERQLRVSAATLAYGFTPDDVIYHPDRPELEQGKHRVSSAFTVESDLPFSAIQPNCGDAGDGQYGIADAGSLETMRNMEEALLTSGIKIPGSDGNPGRTYRVSDLESTVEIPDVTHTGQITGEDGAAKDAVFYICREDEVAGPFQKRNLSVAARHRRVPYACIVGFGHEGDASSLERSQGTVTILEVMANRDLMIPDLQHKRDDNAFVVISEPDLVVHNEPENKISIEVRGLTTYNPATGQVEPTGDRSIAAIMTDTAYDQESFKVCLLNLTLQGQQEDRRLKQIRAAFRREIDDGKWQRMRSSRTLPFKTPAAGGKVAVKVVDRTGVEHMKVLNIG